MPLNLRYRRAPDDDSEVYRKIFATCLFKYVSFLRHKNKVP